MNMYADLCMRSAQGVLELRLRRASSYGIFSLQDMLAGGTVIYFLFDLADKKSQTEFLLP